MAVSPTRHGDSTAGRSDATTGKTVMEISESIGLNPTVVAQLLQESWESGFVVPTSSGWRLSDGAEEKLGPALRGLGEGPLRTAGWQIGAWRAGVATSKARRPRAGGRGRKERA